MKSVAIVGAGASGLLCAIECAKANLHVDVFEQNTAIGKKILVSGNGRCNITNTQLHTEDYFGEDPAFVTTALKQFGFKTQQNYFQTLGLLFDIKADGRVYPLSNEAKSVVYTLSQAATLAGVNFHLEHKITSIQSLLKQYDFVVLATGSRAASNLGGSNSGEHLAQECNHTIIPPYPALVQLEINSNIIHKMAGAKITGSVTLFINNQAETTSHGDILFTNYGISGFSILDLSQQASYALQHHNHVMISINLLPSLPPQNIAKHLTQTAKKQPNFTLIDILNALLPRKIALQILHYLHLQPEAPLQTLTPKIAKKIAHTLSQWRFEIEDTHGFRHAEVAGGGVSTQEIDPKTFASYKQKNLYITGELLDIVGRRGGYNFAFAWASGWSAAQNIIARA